MLNSDAFKRFLNSYILVQAETTFNIGIVGTLFAPEVRVEFWFFFMPAIMGMVCMLPCIPLYVNDNLSITQVKLLRLLELVVLVMTMEFMTYLLLGNRVAPWLYVGVSVVVSVFEGLTYVIMDYLEKREIDLLNEKLDIIREE